jgi:hypothetical protein
MNLYGFVGNDGVNWVDFLGMDIVVNNTGANVTVSGNLGGGHGAGNQAFGVIRPGATGGGTANPIPAYPTRQAAENAADPNFVGPHQSVGEIQDVDFYDDPDRKTKRNDRCDEKLSGDEEGPTTELLPNEDGKGGIYDDSRNLTVPGSYWRWMWR